jgi:prepilin-type processing-associated H-X9-DG protein
MPDAAVKRPSMLVAFADACEANSDASVVQGYSFVYPPYNINGREVTTGDLIHFRHDRGANVLWADGHVDRQRPSRLKGGALAALAERECIGGFGPDDSSLFDPR